MNRKLLSIIILIVITTLAGCSAAANYYKDGKKSFEAKDYAKAAESFSKAIEQNPNRGDYYVDYGMALTALGKYEEAIDQFNRAYINKDMTIVKENNKLALRGKGIAYYKMNNYNKAVSVLEKALQIDELSGMNVDILYYIGKSYREIGSYQKAADTYTKILSEGKNAAAFAERAYCYRSLKQFDKSQADYDSAITLEPNNFNYYFGKYNLLAMKGDASTAKDVLAKAAQIKITTEEDKFSLAKLYYYQGDYDKALKQLETSLTNGYKEAQYYIGEIYRLKKDYTKAIFYYDKYIKSGDVSTSNVYNQISVCLIKTGEYKKAVKYLEKGIALGNTESLQIMKKNEIAVYEDMGDFDTAKKKLKEYLQIYPEDKEAIREADFVDTRLIDSKKK